MLMLSNVLADPCPISSSVSQIFFIKNLPLRFSTSPTPANLPPIPSAGVQSIRTHQAILEKLSLVNHVTGKGMNKTPSTNNENQEFLEIKSVSLEWKLSNLKHIFDSSKGESKSKCVKSDFFGGTKWQVFFYPNSGHEQYCSLYLSCQPTAEEFERAAMSQLTTHALPSTTNTNTSSSNGQHLKPLDPSQVPWHREGLFKFTFEIKSLDRRTTYKTMEANDHAFSHQARNWGWAQYWRRNDAYYSNHSAKFNDAFLICCTIVYSPTPPVSQPSTQGLKKSIPLDLLEAYSSLFNDPLYSDICFKIIRRRSRHSAGGSPNGLSSIKTKPTCVVRRLYASKKILIRRSEYFSTMFGSGFAESSAAAAITSDRSDEMSQVRDRRYSGRLGASDDGDEAGDDDDLMDEDSDDLDDDEDEEEEQEEEDDDDDDETEQEETHSEEFRQGAPGQTHPSDSHPTRSADDEGRGGVDKPVQADVGAEETVGVLTSDEVAEEAGAGLTPVNQVPDPGEHPPHSSPLIALESEPPLPTQPAAVQPSALSAVSPKKPLPHVPSTPTQLSQDNRPINKSALPANHAPAARPEKKRVPSLPTKSAKKKARPALMRKMTVIEVTDAAYTTFKALLFFLYTDTISFAPLSSTYECLKDEAAETGVAFGYASRKEYAKAMAAKVVVYGNGALGARGPTMDGSLVCSAKAIYRLADKLNLTDLKAKAYDHITRSLSVQNIPMEVFSSFTSAFEEIRKVEVSYMLRHWNEVRDSRSMKTVLAMLSEGGKACSGFSEVWATLLSNLEYRPKAESINGAGGAGTGRPIAALSVPGAEGAGPGGTHLQVSEVVEVLPWQHPPGAGVQEAGN